MFCFELFDWFIFEPVGNMLFIQGNIFRISELLFRLKYFPKKLFFPTTTFAGLCSSDHLCMKILFLVGILSKGVIYLQTISASLKLFEKHYAHIKAISLWFRDFRPTSFLKRKAEQEMLGLQTSYVHSRASSVPLHRLVYLAHVSFLFYDMCAALVSRSYLLRPLRFKNTNDIARVLAPALRTWLCIYVRPSQLFKNPSKIAIH